MGQAQGEARIWPRVAPRDRRRPISGRRSSTEMTMVLATPTPPAGTVAGQPVGYVEGLLEMMAEREVEERPAAGHEFHGRRQPALDDC